jgi:hypothetical protein
MQPVARIVVRKLRLMEHLLFGSNPGISTIASVSRSRSQCQEGEIASLCTLIYYSRQISGFHHALTISSRTVENIDQASAALQLPLD